MSWWQAKDHPIWQLAQMAIGAFVLAWLGADSLDQKDVAAVFGGAVVGRFVGGRN